VARRRRPLGREAVWSLADAGVTPAPHGLLPWPPDPRHAHHGDELLSTDTVFGVKPSLVKEFIRQEPGTPTPDGRVISDGTWSRTRFDIVLAPEGA
jgi:hypothetical protein